MANTCPDHSDEEEPWMCACARDTLDASRRMVETRDFDDLAQQVRETISVLKECSEQMKEAQSALTECVERRDSAEGMLKKLKFQREANGIWTNSRL